MDKAITTGPLLTCSGEDTIRVVRLAFAERYGAGMSKLCRRAMLDQRGFTLVELLIVVAIMGILAGVVIPNVGTLIGGSTKTAANTELANVRTASIAYLGDHLGWPADSTGLGDYMLSQPKATYVFDAATGYAVGVSDVSWSNIRWCPPVGSPPTGDGHWDR
jgi:prepilin-type N-terminal cleavage/methylation domain-containing protein